MVSLTGLRAAALEIYCLKTLKGTGAGKGAGVMIISLSMRPDAHYDIQNQISYSYKDWQLHTHTTAECF